MLVLLSNGNGSSPCIYHTEDSFYQQYPYKLSIIQTIETSLFNIYHGKGQKGDGNGTVTVVSNINPYKWGIIQTIESSLFNIYQEKGQKGDGNGTVTKHYTHTVTIVL